MSLKITTNTSRQQVHRSQRLRSPTLARSGGLTAEGRRLRHRDSCRIDISSYRRGAGFQRRGFLLSLQFPNRNHLRSRKRLVELRLQTSRGLMPCHPKHCPTSARL